jgi:uncharacterized protein
MNNMAIEVINPAHWLTQRWQNGGGITHQLARADDEHGLRWRVSIAEVASDGPFSQFENIDRIILLLDGAGFRLFGVGANPQLLNTPLQPFAFEGDSAVHCSLINGPVRDFNLMYRRGSVCAALAVLAIDASSQQVALCPQCLIYVASGTVRAVIQQNHYILETGQTLCLSNETAPLLLSGADRGQILLIQLNDTTSG